jgi:metallo-beta-lactamase family protein
MINISHHGAVSGVTGSCHELSINPPDRSHPSAGILIDCGLFQGADAAGRLARGQISKSVPPLAHQSVAASASIAALAIDFPLDHIRALVVTHVHTRSGYFKIRQQRRRGNTGSGWLGGT